MRARYSAFATGQIDFIKSTHHNSTISGFDEEGTKEWATKSKWLGLEILSTEQGQNSDQTGKVEFKAKYQFAGFDHIHHELSDFKKENGHWFFVDGKVFKTPLVHSDPKIGRNDPCSCGSGKKYKKCCGK